MKVPFWARRLIVFLFMVSVSAAMYLSLPVDSRDEFIWTLRNLAGPLFVFLGLVFIFIRLVKWADGDNHE